MISLAELVRMVAECPEANPGLSPLESLSLQRKRDPFDEIERMQKPEATAKKPIRLERACEFAPRITAEYLQAKVASAEGCFQAASVFLLAHEAAHVVLGHTSSTPLTEMAADSCAQAVTKHLLGSSQGSLDHLLFRAIIEDGAELWGLSDSSLAEVEQRLKRLSTAEARPVAEACGLQ